MPAFRRKPPPPLPRRRRGPSPCTCPSRWSARAAGPPPRPSTSRRRSGTPTQCWSIRSVQSSLLPSLCRYFDEIRGHQAHFSVDTCVNIGAELGIVDAPDHLPLLDL